MIEVKHLTKCYGDFKAVDDLSFTIDEGNIYGFLGPNGAGKSTTMNMMTGCLSMSDGSITIDGWDIFDEPEKAKKLIGYLPEMPPLYSESTPNEYLTFVGEAKGLKKGEIKKEVERVIKETQIEDVKDKLIKYLSKGYRQRVGIAQALLGNPKVIILDEPTVGLDPAQIIEIRELISNLGKSHTVILSSHILSEVQAICNKILIISKGKLIAFDTAENLEKLFIETSNIELVVSGELSKVNKVLNSFKKLKYESQENDGKVKVSLTLNDNNTDEICKELSFAFAEKKLAIIEMKVVKATLEDVFMELTKDEKEEKDDSRI